MHVQITNPFSLSATIVASEYNSRGNFLFQEIQLDNIIQFFPHI